LGLQLGARSDIVEVEGSGRASVKYNQHKAHNGQRPPCVGGGLPARRNKMESDLHQPASALLIRSKITRWSVGVQLCK
jgi:hypothetical protein